MDSAKLQGRVNQLEEEKEVQRSEKLLYKLAYSVSSITLQAIKSELGEKEPSVGVILRLIENWETRKVVFDQIGHKQVWEMEKLVEEME